MLERAVIYCRVSTKEQAENLSLPTQMKVCRAYCGQQGWEVVREFEERGESAKTTDRPEFQAMLAFCTLKKNRVKFLVCYDVSRFSRNNSDYQWAKALLLKQNINICPVTQCGIDDSPQGRLMETILVGFAQFDNDVKAVRTREGMKEAIGKGIWVWQTPLGYQRVNGNIAPDTTQGPILRQVFEHFATGRYTKHEIFEMAVAAGLKACKGGAIAKQTLYTAFSNPVYKGVIFSPKWGIEKKGAFEPLVSEDTFWRVQMVMSGKSPTAKPHHRANPDFPLRRFIVCEHCRGSMTGSFSKGRRGRYPYYHCPRCKGVGVRREQLEGMFLEMLHTVAFSPEKLNTFENVLQERWKDRHEQTRKQRVLLEQHQKEVQGRRARLDEAFIYEKAIDKHLYDEHRTKLQEEADRVRQQISELEFAKLDVEGLFDFARASLTHPETTWQGMDYYQRQRF